MTFERSLLHAGLWPVLIALALASGCSDRPPDEEVPAETEAPPSVQEAPAAAQVVRLDTRQAAELDVQTVAVQSGSFRYAVTLPGTVYPAPENFSIVSAPISGRVANIYAHEGEAVRKGQVLLELESLEFANLAAEYLQARAEEAYQESQVERLQLLVEKKISPQSALDKAQADLLRASAAVSGTYARLKAIGIRDEQIAAWSAAQPERPLLQIYAPISGVIDRHDVDLGQSVTSYEQMMSLIDPSRVLVRGYVSPEEAPALTPGDPVTIAQKDFPDLQLAAKVATLNPALDEQNKSVTVNVLADTRDGWPMPGQSVQLQISVSTPQPVLTVPLAAVEYEGEQATVFVRTDAHTFQKRYIEVGRMTDADVLVSRGLEGGEEVAVTQIFSLKALGRYEQYAEE